MVRMYIMGSKIFPWGKYVLHVKWSHGETNNYIHKVSYKKNFANNIYHHSHATTNYHTEVLRQADLPIYKVCVPLMTYDSPDYFWELLMDKAFFGFCVTGLFFQRLLQVRPGLPLIFQRTFRDCWSETEIILKDGYSSCWPNQQCQSMKK